MMNYHKLEREGRLLILPKAGECESCILQCGDCGSCGIFGYYKGSADDCIRERKRIIAEINISEINQDFFTGKREEISNE